MRPSVSRGARAAACCLPSALSLSLSPLRNRWGSRPAPPRCLGSAFLGGAAPPGWRSGFLSSRCRRLAGGGRCLTRKGVELGRAWLQVNLPAGATASASDPARARGSKGAGQQVLRELDGAGAEGGGVCCSFPFRSLLSLRLRTRVPPPGHPRPGQGLRPPPPLTSAQPRSPFLSSAFLIPMDWTPRPGVLRIESTAGGTECGGFLPGDPGSAVSVRRRLVGEGPRPALPHPACWAQSPPGAMGYSLAAGFLDTCKDRVIR